MIDAAADQRQRRRAVSPVGSFIVQAPAGSGKTELLIQRYLALLACVDHPEEIVAITFTRKAAAEMRGRIIEALDCARLGREPAGGDAAACFELASRALQRDASRNWQLRANPGRLRVQTVDALCAHLTRQLPILSRFGSQPETVEDASEAYREAASATLEHLDYGDEWSESIAVLLEHLDNDLPKARDLIADMLSRRDQWLEHVLNPRRDHLEGGLRRLVESSLKTAARAVPGECAAELPALLGFAAGNLARAGDKSPIAACAGLRALPGCAAGELQCWRGVAELLLSRDGDWRKRADASIGFPPAAGGKSGAKAREAMKRRFADLLPRLGEHETLRRILDDIRHLPPPAYSDSEWRAVAALCRVLTLADAKLSVVFAERDQIDFAGVTRAAITALGGDENPTDLALYLDYRIRHILVDEFQDISVNQYQLLCRLTAGWTAGDGRTLFVVGDPMQSIYRFREADVGLFLDTWAQQRVGQVPLVPLHMTVNFRSVPGIVDWVNDTFGLVLPELADSARGAVPHAPARAFHAPGGAHPIRIHALGGAGDAAGAQRVLHLVEEARRADPEGSIAILVRNRSNLPAILTRLKRAGVRFRALEIEGLGHRPVIQDLLALTRALHHFSDRIAWLAVLRAPWCGLALEDLLRLAGEADEKPVWEKLRDPGLVASLSVDARARVTRLRLQFEAALSERRRRPLRRWVESTWLRLGGAATLRHRSDLINAETFFDLMDEFDAGGDLVDLDRFVEAVQSLFAAPDTEADPHLHVLTIHKSKGLEFDTVIVPGLDRGRRQDEPRLLLWTARADATGRRDLLLAPVRAAAQEEAPIYDCLRRLEREKQEYEEGRLMYVAATRARKRLHLIACLVEPGGAEPRLAAPRPGSLLAQLWPALEGQFRENLENDKVHEVPAGAPAAGTARSVSRLPVAWEAPAPLPAVAFHKQAYRAREPFTNADIEFQWAGETIRHVGTVVHAYLARVAADGLAAWSPERIHAMRRCFEIELNRLGVPGPDVPAAAAEVENALASGLLDSRGRWLLDAGHADRRSELALSGLHEGRLVHVRIDRSFVDADGVRWIVDYKTSRHEGPDLEAFLDREQQRYAGTMGVYATLLSRIDRRPIRLGLYFPLLKGWREWGFEG